MNLINVVKAFIIILLVIIFSFIISFGFWYLIIWFITGNIDLFTWNWWVKLVYLILAGLTLRGFAFEIKEKTQE